MEAELRSLQDMWQIPYICQFIKLFRGSLNMDLVTPEELEQAILAPIQSALCSELMSKLLLKRSGTRRDLPPGEGYPFIKWSDMLNKQIASWQRTYLKYSKSQNNEKMSTASKLVVKMMTELGGNPFVQLVTTPKIEETPQPKPTSSRLRETRSQTNSLPKNKKKYTDEYLEHSSDLGEEEEKFLSLGEIPVNKRVIVIHYLCLLKLETEEEILHELNYVPIEQQRVLPIGSDSQGAVYFYFNNVDCRIYKTFNGRFSLVAKTIEGVKDLIEYLQTLKSFELARVLSSMTEDFVKNEQERNRKISNLTRKINSLAVKKKINEFDFEDSDFSPVEEDDIPKKRGPGRPRKNPLPETKPKIMPETNGNKLIFTGKLKKIATIDDVFYNFIGKWELDEKHSSNFSFIKKKEGESGVYHGSWQFYTNPIDESVFISLEPAGIVTGSGENLFGIFSISGNWTASSCEEVHGEKEVASLSFYRNYMKFDLGEDSSGSENENEVYDIIKPPYQLEFEEKLQLEHMRMPLKSLSELKKALQSQDKRELRRIAFFKSEYLN
jgi:hypothetical protein